MKDYSTPVEGILKREADGTIASQEVVEVELVDLATVATSGSYNDLTNKPTIPAVNDATITIKQGSATKGSFTTNQSSGKTITLDANTDTLGKNIVGTSATASSNGAVSGTDGVYLNHIEGTNTVKSTHKIVGSGATTVKSDANGNITISTPATDISKLQPKITANGFLKGDGSGNITADKPAFCVMIDKAQDGTITVNKTQEEIHEAYSSGYAVYADYGDWDWGTTLQVLVAKIRITIFAGVYIITDDSVVYIVVSNTGSGWVERMVVVPLADKVVPTIRTINTKPLSSDITLTAADVGAASKDVERPYLVTFTKGTGDNYTADKTLKEIYDAVQAGNYVYGYVNTNGYWAYIPLGSCFTTGTNTISYFIYFEGPLANGNGSMVARNKVIRYISLTGLNNADATSKQYKFVTYNAVPSDIAINKKALSTGDITLTPSDIGSSLKITFTLDETTGFYNSNKTLNDIYLAHSNGSVVYSKFNNEIYELTKCYKSGSNYHVTFTLIKSSGVMPQTTETKFENYGTESQDVSFKQTINYLPVLNQASIDNNTNGGYVYMSSNGASMIQKPSATDVNAVGLTGDQTIAGNKTFNGKATFKSTVDFTNATVTGLMTAAVGTTTDYSIYIGSTAPAANTAPLIWIDTSASGVMKYRTSTTSTTWTAVPVAWG